MNTILIAIIIGLALLAGALLLICLLQRADIVDLERNLRSALEMYSDESNRNLEKIMEDAFMDEQELSRRGV